MLTTVLTLALTLASTTAPEAGTAQLTFGGETTVHPIAACAMTPPDVAVTGPVTFVPATS